MTVSFVLPPISTKVVGGLKIIYQYANYLAANNCDVILYYRSSGHNSKHIPEWIVRTIRHHMLTSEPKWFKLNPKIKKMDFRLPSELKSDVIIATDYGSVEFVSKSDIPKRYYFIQDFENWTVSDEDVYKSYQIGFGNIVVSMWLKEVVDKHSKKDSVYIPNGIDLKVFRVLHPDIDRGHSIAMLYHMDKRKGCDVGLKVINRLKKKYPDLTAYLFGSPERPNDFPEWINYTHSATQSQVAELDNRATVFLCTSRQEGYGLTGLESMACGCSLVTTDCKGIKEYAVDGHNALMCTVDDEDALYQSCCRLFDDKELKTYISSNAVTTSQKFDINIAMKRFYDTVTKQISVEEKK